MSWKIARQTKDFRFKPKNVKVGDRFKVVSKGNNIADNEHITEVILIQDDGTAAPLFNDANSEIMLYINWFRLERVKTKKTKQKGK